MPFLTNDDYGVQARAEVLDRIGNAGALPMAELMARAEMESYLNARYDVPEIFGQQGDDRNHLVLMYLVDLVLYHLHSNISPRNVPELRAVRYEAAIEWLKMVSEGKLNPGLPERPGDDGGYYFSGSSNPKYSSPW